MTCLHEADSPSVSLLSSWRLGPQNCQESGPESLLMRWPASFGLFHAW
jgi:hypothetical protein